MKNFDIYEMDDPNAISDYTKILRELVRQELRSLNFNKSIPAIAITQPIDGFCDIKLYGEGSTITNVPIRNGLIVNQNDEVYVTFINSSSSNFFIDYKKGYTLPAYSTTTNHNDLPGLQGGSTASRYHLTNTEHANLTSSTPTFAGINVGDVVGGNYFKVESDGTIVFLGNATAWKDIMFPQAPPKTTGAGNPTLVTWNGNLRGYSYAVNDVHDFDPQEIEHDAKVGSTATWHIHIVSRSNDASDRYVRYELEYAVEPNSGVVPTPTVVSSEFMIPAGTGVNTVLRENITTFTISNIGRMVYARLKRISATGGTAPSVDPVLSGLHFHYEVDTVGSRSITTK